MLLFILLCLITNFISLSGNQQISEERYIDVLASTFQRFKEREGDFIWPHFDLVSQPILFHFPNRHVYAFGLESSSSFWKERKTSEGHVLFSNHFPDVLPPLQPAYPLEKEKVFVMSLGQGMDASFFPLLTFIHERFHITQFHSFAKERVVEAELSDYQSIEFLTWMELEHRLLTSFLKAVEDEIKLRYLKDYVAISHMRRSFLHPNTIRWEDHQQKMEGLADYVSVRTFQVIPSIENFKGEEFFLEMRKRKCKGIVNTQDALKGRHYFVGGVLGWSLDFCNVNNWKEQIEGGSASLQEMVEKALHMTEEQMEKRFIELLKSYDWKSIQDQIQHQIDKERLDKEEVLQAFKEQEGILIHMGTPHGPMSSGGSHQKMVLIDRTKVLTKDTSQALSQDQMWKLNFQSIPFIFEEQNGDRTFKLHCETILSIDGREISLKEIFEGDKKERYFYTLSLKGVHCELDSSRRGKLYVRDGSVVFEFN